MKFFKLVLLSTLLLMVLLIGCKKKVQTVDNITDNKSIQGIEIKVDNKTKLLSFNPAFYENKTSDEKINSLMNASINGNLAVVKYLIEIGVDVNSETYDSFTPLIYASLHGHLEVVKYLIEQGADITIREQEDSRDAFIMASSQGHDEIVKYLVANGAEIKNVQVDDDINSTDEEGNTVLMYAVQEGNVEAVKTLLSNGADHSVQNNYGETALYWSASDGNFEILKLLIEAGAVDVKGRNSIDIADHKGHVEIVEYLESLK